MNFNKTSGRLPVLRESQILRVPAADAHMQPGEPCARRSRRKGCLYLGQCHDVCASGTGASIILTSLADIYTNQSTLFFHGSKTVH